MVADGTGPLNVDVDDILLTPSTFEPSGNDLDPSALCLSPVYGFNGEAAAAGALAAGLAGAA